MKIVSLAPEVLVRSGNMAAKPSYDEVIILAGKDKGKKGKVTKVPQLVKHVEGINLLRNTKSRFRL